MNTVDVEILGQVITAQYGTLNTGDVLRTTPEFAKHLVEDCSAAKYRNSPARAPVAASESEMVLPQAQAEMVRAQTKQQAAPAVAGKKPKK